LYEWHKQLLKEGAFAAYNQWLFGSVDNLAGYQNWVNANKKEYTAFANMQRNILFKIPTGQYYSKP
jgi:hypothetical protein